MSEEKKKQKIKNSEQRRRDLWDTMKSATIFLIKVREGKERKEKKLFE